MCKCNYITFLNISIAISLNVIGRLRAKLFSNEKRPMLNINVTNRSDKCNRPEYFLFRSMSVACFKNISCVFCKILSLAIPIALLYPIPR